MEFLRGTAGAEGDPKLAAFVEKSRQSWLGMMKDQELVTFEQREQRAVDEGRLLARLLLEEQLARDPAVKPGEHDQRACCPKCGQPGERVSKAEEAPPERALKTRAGRVRFAREQWKCRACRVVFFPLGSEVGTGDGGFQSGGDQAGGA
jgi:uncharacterized protein with PIN domain